jgi:hypothetical protein
VVEADFFGWMLDVPGGEGSELGRQAEELAAALPLDLTLHFVALRRRSAIVSPNGEPPAGPLQGTRPPILLATPPQAAGNCGACMDLAWGTEPLRFSLNCPRAVQVHPALTPVATSEHAQVPILLASASGGGRPASSC